MSKVLKPVVITLFISSSLLCIPQPTSLKEQIGELFVEILGKKSQLKTTILQTYERSSYGKFQLSSYSSWYNGIMSAAIIGSVSLFAYGFAKKTEWLFNHTIDANKEEMLDHENQCNQILSDAKKLGCASAMLICILYVFEKKFEINCQENCALLQEELDELWKKMNVLLIAQHQQ